MLKTRKNLRLTSTLVNLTGGPIYIYNDVSGGIEEFPPESWITNPDYDACGHPRLYYVVDGPFLERLKMIGRTLDDIAVVSETGVGYGNIIVSYLESAENSDLKIRYRNCSSFRVA